MAETGAETSVEIKDLSSNVKPKPIEEEMKTSYLDYSMSVIVGRALPDVRDGLKPVHRRIIYAMYEAGMTPKNPYKKSARIVGDVLGKYHPHGDTSVYDAIVRMAQSFSLRYPLVDGQGNFGSVDGDSAAAMRYTESRMSKYAMEMIVDIDKETVDFGPNYDGSLKEPLVLPSKLPNLLVNGSSGIAVGMATNIPPHNMREVSRGLIKIIDNPECDLIDLMEDIRGPDFPTGGIICGLGGIRAAYHTGRGKIVVRAKTHVEEMKTKKALIVTEIPYQVNKTKLIEDIADLVKEKKIEGIADLRDESDKDGMRMVIEIKREFDENIILNQLYKHTALQTTFGMINLALVDNQPRVLTLMETLKLYLEHRKDIVRRRTLFDLKRAQEKAHILEGLIVAVSNIDEVINIIRKSKDAEEADGKLMARFSLTHVQAKAILDMKLSKLTGLEIEALKKDFEETKLLITELAGILADPAKIMAIIRKELSEMEEKFGDDRRTEIDTTFADLELEDLIPVEDVVITVTNSGYIKRIQIDTYKKQRRGGKGMMGLTTKEEDFVTDLLVMSTHDYLLFFTNRGKVYWKKGYQIPEGGRYSTGRAIRNVLEFLEEGEVITAAIPVHVFDDEHYLLFVTKKGVIKKTMLSLYSNVRRKGIKAIKIDPEDELIQTVLSNGLNDVFLASKNGQAIRFFEGRIRTSGRASRGVRGMRLEEGDEIVSLSLVDANLTDEEKARVWERIAMDKAKAAKGVEEAEEEEASKEEEAPEEENGPEAKEEPGDEPDAKEAPGDEAEEDAEVVQEECPGQKILTITEHGFGKRTVVDKYRRIGRGGKGVKTIICNDRNGKVVCVRKVELDQDLIITTLSGKIIRIPVMGISLMGRNTQGVRVMKLEEADKVVAVAVVEGGQEEDEPVLATQTEPVGTGTAPEPVTQTQPAAPEPAPKDGHDA